MDDNLALLPTPDYLQERLWQLIVSMGGGAYMAPQRIVAIRQHYNTQESREILAQMRAQSQEATPAEIITFLARLSIHYWAPDLTEAQQKLRFQDFCSDLKGVTVKGIREACDAWRKSDAVHFPKPGQLLKLCRDEIAQRAKDMRGIDRLEAVLDGHDETLWLEEKQVSSQRMKEIKDALGGFGRPMRTDH